MAWTADDLVTAVRLRARIPTGSSAMIDAQILALADDTIRTDVVPLVVAGRDNYYVKTRDVALVASQGTYRLPQWALGGAVRSLSLLTAAGDETPLREVPLERVGEYSSGAWPASRPVAVIDGDMVRLVPAPTATGDSLRVRYHYRPGALVSASSTHCYEVSSISQAYRYNAASVPTTFTTSTPVDVVESRPGLDLLLRSVTPSAVVTGASGYVTLASLADSEGIADGTRSLTSPAMYVVHTGYSPIVQVPDVCQGPLADLVAGRVMGILGRIGPGDRMMELGGGGLRRALAYMRPRNQGASRKAVDWETPLRYGRARR